MNADPEVESVHEADRAGADADLGSIVSSRKVSPFLFCSWLSVAFCLFALVFICLGAFRMWCATEYMGRRGNPDLFDSMITQLWVCQAGAALTGVLGIMLSVASLIGAGWKGAAGIRRFAWPALLGSIACLVLDALVLVVSFGLCFLQGLARIPH